LPTGSGNAAGCAIGSGSWKLETHSRRTDKMKKSQQWLGGILAAQVLVSTTLLFGSAWEGESRGPQPLLDFEASNVDRMVISASDANTQLQKQSESWQLQEHALPANSSKVQSLLDTLA